ncbi:PAS domain S-box protein [Hymenobacter sp. GOD-10R]|uniref:PAS domain S-box protein n=1 Tax=Hymenobacter sp. GOD-10R TaxID=3093922 RepID=UPI002D79C089|nr:PAS domain S-box protein [Hymenobacter sp. GOD-10R]WRQ29053.1 PAS domain S-box protein [Hymenobacter sp. GOD-10R]
MSSIALRHLRRQLQWTRRAQAAAEGELHVLREQIQEQNVAAARQASALFQTMSTAVVALTQHYTVALVNERLCGLFGLTERPELYVGEVYTALFDQATIKFCDAHRVRAQLRSAVYSQTRVTGLIAKLTDGKVLQCDYLPVVQEGQTTLHLWSFENVTQQQQTQQRIQELSRLAEQSPYPIINFNRIGQALYANPAAESVLTDLASPTEQACQEHLLREIAQALAECQPRTSERQLANHFYLWTVVPLPQEESANVYLTDITARRNAEADLLRSQLFVARINDTVPILLLLYDLEEQQITYANRQCYHLLGYSESEIMAMDRVALIQLVVVEDRHLLPQQSIDLKHLVDGQTVTAEYRLRHRDGTHKWFRFMSTVFTRHPDGRVKTVVASAQDITQQRTTELALHQSQLFVERIANTAPNMIYLFDLRTLSNVYSNRQAYSLFGYTEDELQQMGSGMLAQLFPASEVRRIERHIRELQKLADGEVLTIEVYIIHRSGFVRWIRMTHSPFERDAHGAMQQIIGVAEDITKWKTADEQRRAANRRLAEQNHLFRQVIDTTPHLIYLKDEQGNYLLANRATADLFGLSTAEIIRTNPSQLPVNAEEAAEYLQFDRQVITTGREVVGEDKFTQANGDVMWFYSIRRPFELADGTVQVLGVSSNITELKQVQNALREAKEAAEENANTKQAFLANMSHEIRTPMNGVLGLASLLAKTPLDEQQSQYLDHIRHSAENLLVVINDILAMAQLGAGKIRPEATHFDLREVLQASLHSLQPRANEKGIVLQLEEPSAQVATFVIGDPYRLRQVLLNLLSNAVKFTNDGTVWLSCRLLTESEDEVRFEFSVRDTGIGIPAHQLKNVFEAFTQASDSTAREYGGSGLGLSISRGLVELLRGEITAESQPNEGSTFRFSLPFAPASADAIPVPSALPESHYQSLGDRRVLLTEDNRINQMLVEVILRNWGMHVDTASTGQEAIALFQQHRYDVVLMDIQMPGLDGVATTNLLRQHADPERAATPVIALTAHAMPGENERYRAAGLDGYLSKPFREEDLFRVMATALQERPQVTQLPTVAPVQEPAEPLYDLSSIRRLTHDNEAFVRRLVNLFIQTTPPCVQDLEKHLADQQWEALSAAAHHLKSSLDGLQIKPLHDTIRQIEACKLAPTDLTAVETQVARVRDVTTRVIAQLQEEFPN